MPWIALTLLAVAIALWRISQPNPDDVVQVLGGLFALISAMAGLIIAPALLKSLVLLGILVYPTPGSRWALGQRPPWPRLGLWQGHCAPALNRQFADPHR